MTRVLTILGVTAALLFATGQAKAQPLQVHVPPEVSPGDSKLTRAEVLADLHLYRSAGMYELTRGLNPFDAYSYHYRKQNATYLHLRQSPAYAELAGELERRPNAQVVAAPVALPRAGAPN